MDPYLSQEELTPYIQKVPATSNDMAVTIIAVSITASELAQIAYEIPYLQRNGIVNRRTISLNGRNFWFGKELIEYGRSA